MTASQRLSESQRKTNKVNPLAAGSASAQQPSGTSQQPVPTPPYGPPITLEQAKRVMAAAELEGAQEFLAGGGHHPRQWRQHGDVPQARQHSACLNRRLRGQVRGAAFAIPGAFGAQEAGLILLCGLFEIPPDQAFALSLMKRAADLVVGVPGLVSLEVSFQSTATEACIGLRASCNISPRSAPSSSRTPAGSSGP